MAGESESRCRSRKWRKCGMGWMRGAGAQPAMAVGWRGKRDGSRHQRPTHTHCILSILRGPRAGVYVEKMVPVAAPDTPPAGASDVHPAAPLTSTRSVGCCWRACSRKSSPPSIAPGKSRAACSSARARKPSAPRSPSRCAKAIFSARSSATWRGGWRSANRSSTWRAPTSARRSAPCVPGTATSTVAGPQDGLFAMVSHLGTMVSVVAGALARAAVAGQARRRRRRDLHRRRRHQHRVVPRGHEHGGRRTVADGRPRGE